MARSSMTLLALTALVSCLAPAMAGGYYTTVHTVQVAAATPCPPPKTVTVVATPCPPPPAVTVTVVKPKPCTPPVTVVKVPAPPAPEEPCEPDAPDAPCYPSPPEPDAPEEPEAPEAPDAPDAPVTITVTKKPPTGVAYQKPPTVTTVLKKSPPPTITTTKKSPPPTITTTTTGFPYCVCNRAAVNPYTVTGLTSPSAGTYCIAIASSGATPSWDLRKLEVDINPACKGTIKGLTFNGKKLAPSYASYPAQKATVVKATLGTGNLATYSSIAANGAELCVTLSGACSTPETLCTGGACKLAFFNPTKSSCPIFTAA